MVSDDLDPVDADEAAGVLARAAADAGDEQVAAGEPRQLGAGRSGECELRAGHDRVRPVDVEDERAPPGACEGARSSRPPSARLGYGRAADTHALLMLAGVGVASGS